MSEFIQDSSQPQFLSPEAFDFLCDKLGAFEAKQAPEKRLGAAAIASFVAPERPDFISADPELEKAFTGYLYDGLLACLDQDPVILGKRQLSGHYQDLLKQTQLYAELLTAGSLAPLTIDRLPLEQGQYTRYCQLLTEQISTDLGILGYNSIDEMVQLLKRVSTDFTHEQT
ncbi:MAG: hypothetical protein JWO41_321 [Candidatus Saccharibacteria bacterium]|nr:hypothetical protein [Candidatus Saccharibacteria bacterium]